MYNKPMILVNDDLAEGVYAASGTTTDCWTVNVYKDQTDAGGYCTFRIDARHKQDAVHISTKTVVTVVFSGPVTSAEFENFESSVSGNTVTLTRIQHANGYKAGDNFNSLLKIWAPDYQSINAVSYGISCTHAVNVQGGFD